MRLFVSVDLPEALTCAIADLQNECLEIPGLNGINPAQAHITLKFLGTVESSRVSELTAALDTAVDDVRIEPFDTEFGGLGVFPNIDYISVVWLGVEAGTKKLAVLHDAVEHALTTRCGVEPENHEFTPHVTLARMKHAGGKRSVQEVVRSRHPRVGTMRVTEICLTESHLTSDGPEYETVHVAEL